MGEHASRSVQLYLFLSLCSWLLPVHTHSMSLLTLTTLSTEFPHQEQMSISPVSRVCSSPYRWWQLDECLCNEFINLNSCLLVTFFFEAIRKLLIFHEYGRFMVLLYLGDLNNRSLFFRLTSFPALFTVNPLPQLLKAQKKLLLPIYLYLFIFLQDALAQMVSSAP